MDRFKLGRKPAQYQRFSETEASKPAKAGILGRWRIKPFKNRGKHSPQKTSLQKNNVKLKQREIRKLAVANKPPTDPKTLRSMAIDAQLAAYPYHRSLEKIHQAGEIHAPEKEDFATQWDPSSELAELIASDAGLTISSEEPGFLYDRNSGLTAYVLINAQLQEVRLVFGGTTSGLSQGDFLERSRKNFKFSGKQWKANIKNMLGRGIPDSFIQAKVLTASLLEKMPSTLEGKPFKLKLNGHSKGGAEANYAALSMTPPVQAVCFSSSELSRKALSDIPRENLAQASQLVTHYNVSKDLVANTGRIFRGLSQAGKVMTIPAKYAYSSLLDRHDKFTRHIEHYARNAASQTSN
ncbi:hypothetical protein [Endozoicomonas arenosclerae]|uniref:hypothetical protein n=1 Tax=Endozoicomonas arenosclerae TaxID=1633495 RepID=UPI0007842EC0|nr:hypothetical protein [Endozoicomonas arenosclerae]